MKKLLISSFLLASLTARLTFAQNNLKLATPTFNATGSQNVFVGVGTASSNANGNNNAFLGFQAGFNNRGSLNTFLGHSAGQSNTLGSRNTFVGDGAGFANQTGNQNIFVGGNAGQNNLTGSDNLFVGISAGFQNVAGGENVFLGTAAGSNNGGGVRNTFVGAKAGTNSDSDFNTFLGAQTGLNNRDGASNTFLGAGVGIANESGNSNTMVGAQAGNGNVSGSFNVYLGSQAGLNNKSGSNNVFLGNKANAAADNLTNATAIGAQALVTVKNALVLGAIKDKNGASASTNVGIGITNPSFLLHVNGEAAKPGSSSWKVASDQRLKQDIQPFTEGLDAVNKIKPVWFRYNGKAGLPTEKKYVGVIAQDMQKIAPYTIDHFAYEKANGKHEEYLSYDASALSYLLVNAVKQQQGQVEELKARLAEQQKKLKKKDEQVAELKAENQDIRKELTLIKQLLLKNGLSADQASKGLREAASEETPAETASQAKVWQNEPNPTDGSTVIHYRIPEAARTAQMKLFSFIGDEIQSYPLSQRGEGQLVLTLTSLPSGTYIYQLLVDGRSVASKKLILDR